MIGSLRVITGPTEEPLSVDDLQRHLRITAPDENMLLEGYLTAVRLLAEKLLDWAFLTQTLEWALDAFPAWDDEGCSGVIVLPRPPVQSVTSIVYVDPAGAPQTWDPTLYQVDTSATPARIVPAYGQTWPAIRAQPRAVLVTYVAGVATPDLVPEDQKQMLRLAVGTLYELRESVAPEPGGELSAGILEQFFAPYRNALAV